MLRRICRLGGNLWQPRQVPTHMLGGWPYTLLLYIYMLFVYLVRSSDSQQSLVALEDILIYNNIIYFSHPYMHPVRLEPGYRSVFRQISAMYWLALNITSLYSRDQQIPILPLSTTLLDNQQISINNTNNHQCGWKLPNLCCWIIIQYGRHRN